MRVVKDKQFLVFELDNGSIVKYDLQKKQSIGKSGKPVKNLNDQLKNITIEEMCASCENESYGKFLTFVSHHACANHQQLRNIGSVLSRVWIYSKYEQLFSAGIKHIENSFSYNISDMPTGLIRIARDYDITLSNDIYEQYKLMPDVFNLAYNTDYISLSKRSLNYLFTIRNMRQRTEESKNSKWVIYSLLHDYGYTAKALFAYLDRLATYEAIEPNGHTLMELFDYVRMMNSISTKFEKYPKNFLTTHRIASRNYERLKAVFDESMFARRIKLDMEYQIGEYVFLYPKCVQDIKDEAVMQNNCVASYIKDVIDGSTDILLMRDKQCIDKSCVTIEVRNGKIVQAAQRFNDPITEKQQAAIDAWNKWYEKKRAS